jgi:hypothetical protein
VATLVFWIFSAMSLGESQAEWLRNTSIVTAGFAVLCALFSSLALNAASDADRKLHDQSVVAHTKSVQTWLRSDYGITVDEKAVDELAAGQSLVVSYHGVDTLIEFAKRADGNGLAVRVADGHLIQPLTSK